MSNKAKFSEYLYQAIGNLAKKVELSVNTPAYKVKRFNPNKEFNKKNNENSVPWNQQAFYCELDFSPTDDPHWYCGNYYVQEPSSTFIHNLVENKPNLKILDLCASPGGKTTSVLSKSHPTSIIVANEVVSKRCRVLIDNLIRWGSSNVVVTQNQPKEFVALGQYFDYILVDAPCSGEGLIRKDQYILNSWSPEMVKSCNLRQSDIVQSAVKSLKIGGKMIYSTCTFNLEENELVINNLLKNNPELKLVEIEIDPKWNVFVRNGFYRFLPGIAKGEGLTFCVLEKIENLEQNLDVDNQADFKFKELTKKTKSEISQFMNFENFSNIKMLDDKIYFLTDLIQISLQKLQKAGLRIHYFPIKIGTLTKKGFIPSQEILWSQERDKINSKIDKIELNKEQALKILQGKKIELDQNIKTQGWKIATFENSLICWIYSTNERYNIRFDKNLAGFKL
jgi:16S rRNA C967 or C1407 C5-methylase (RsmB/RsmF family)/NOL1/NOP2/fmu family ribosome biogenesis protein